MQVQTEMQAYDTINVTPMLDLAYVLLVVFIVMTTASVQGLSMSLPKPSNKPATDKKHDIKIVQVTSDGSIKLNGAGVGLAELETALSAARARDAEMSVLIKGDAATQYQKVMAVIDLCNRIQVNMGLVTSRIGT
ncbi:MAG: biopolymer transporter ExbD [Betaproteobacteria bacterium]